MAVYLLPLLQIYNCFLFDAWLFIKFLASTNLKSLKRLTSPTVNVPWTELRYWIKLGSLTSVVLTFGPDFQKVVIKNQAITTPKTPNTIWYAYLSRIFYFFLDRLAWAALALSLI